MRSSPVRTSSSRAASGPRRDRPTDIRTSRSASLASRVRVSATAAGLSPTARRTSGSWSVASSTRYGPGADGASARARRTSRSTEPGCPVAVGRAGAPPSAPCAALPSAPARGGSTRVAAARRRAARSDQRSARLWDALAKTDGPPGRTPAKARAETAAALVAASSPNASSLACPISPSTRDRARVARATAQRPTRSASSTSRRIPDSARARRARAPGASSAPPCPVPGVVEMVPPLRPVSSRR